MGKNDSTDRNDKVDIQLIFKKVKDILKEKEIEQKKSQKMEKKWIGQQIYQKCLI